MRHTLLFVLPLAALSLSSCYQSRIPEAVTYPYSQQRKSQAARHWDVLAKDLAAKINTRLVLTGNSQTPVFVEYNCGDDTAPCRPGETSPFNEAFRDLLITNLYDYHIPVRVKASEAALEVTFKVQIVRHAAKRLPATRPGVITTLSAAVAVLRNAPESLVIMATGAGLDLANTNLAINDHNEIIITTSMTQRGEYIFRSSDIYYINDPDFWHYLEKTPDGSQLRFSSRTLRQKERDAATPLIPDVVPIPPPPAADLPQEEPERSSRQESI